MESPDKTVMLSDLKVSISKGDYQEVERIRQEYYNIIASEAKREGDLLKLNLLAASDECTRQGLMGAASVFSTLLAFYELGPIRFDLLCGLVLGPVCSSSMDKLGQQIDELRSNMPDTMEDKG